MTVEELVLRLEEGLPAALREALLRPGDPPPAERLSRLEPALPEGLADRLRRAWGEPRWRRLLEQAENGDLLLLRPGDEAFPRLLEHIGEAPRLLLARGRPELLRREAVAVVGTRRCDDEGRRLAFALAEALAVSGWLVVSGAAEGIDGAAHHGAGPGRTCAVLGAGFEQIYPASHRRLLAAIAREGLLLSEHPPWREARGWQFPRRNRLVSGLSRAVVVVQAPLRSGALITARLALEQGREVFACPGPAGAERFAGCHRLLRDGARLVSRPEELLEDLGSLPLGLPPRPAAEPPSDGELHEALAAPLSREALLQRLGIPPAELAARLLAAQLSGWCRPLPGDRWERCAGG
jgi:DNA processing protein